MPHQPESRDSLFRENRISVGLVLPIRATDGEDVDFRRQVELAALAERLGFAAIWVRDVPLNGPWYPEKFGHSDPFVMLGAIAMATSRIAIGTAATVLTLRHPLHIAKAAISLDRLRFGMELVVAFSVGLAAVLTAIVLLLVYARRIFDRFSLTPGVPRLLPAFSALVVALVGAGIVLRALEQAGVM
mgnify:CR=1 FL=1